MSAVETVSLPPSAKAPEPEPKLLRSTLPPVGSFAQTVLQRSDNLTATRRTSVIAALPGDAGPLPDRYEEGHVLGKGGMGVVVQALDRDLARTVAVKKLQGTDPDASSIERFLREAQITAQLEHPGILPVHDLGVDERRQLYYVMRLVRGGGTLRDLIDRLRNGDPDTVREYTIERRVQLVQQVARVLDYAHAKGVVHRDVKPENIMLGPYGAVYLVDWGLAKVAGPAAMADPRPDPAGTPADHATTRAGSIIGTPLYMAPEQATGEPATPLSDVYSLTAVLYELVTLKHYLGEVPTSLEKLLESVLTQKPVPAVFAAYGVVSRPLSMILEHGLEKDPKKRYASASELEAALEGFLEGHTPVACGATFVMRGATATRKFAERHPMAVHFLVLGSSVALLALVAFAGYAVYAGMYALR